MRTDSFEIRRMMIIALISAVFVHNGKALADDSSATDTTFGIIQFKAPTGWQAADKPGQPIKIFAAPGSNAQQQAMIVVMLAPPKDGLDLRAAFGDVARQMAGANKVEDAGEPTAGTTRQGFAMMSQKLTVADAAGNHASIRLVAANVQNRLAAFCYIAGPAAFFNLHEPEMDALLHSVNFSVGAGDAAEAPATPAAGGDFVAAVHERTAKAMTDAKDQFAKQLEGRRKPHTVLGDVLGLDGKPVPNVVVCQVSVGGTTIAAERTHYSLDVDEHGHFEQQVPDGLYQLNVKCIVKIGDHQFPADIAPLGKVNVDQSSAKGIVADYRLVMDGLKPDADPNGRDAYFGGSLKLWNTNTSLNQDFNSRFPGSRIQALLEPQGPLIDGSTGQAIQLEVASKDMIYGTTFPRLPIGLYHATVKLITADGQTRPLNSSLSFNGTFGTMTDVFWQSAKDYAETRQEPTLYLRE